MCGTWPKVDADIQTYKHCLRHVRLVKKSGILLQVPHCTPGLGPPNPGLRVQIDFAGPFLNRMFLVAVNAYFKWPEMVEMSTGPAGVSVARTIEELRCIFSIHGLPQQIVSDNGPQFVSDQFAQFLKQNGIKHFKSSSYHPFSNELTK